jgi:hypothetical protein
MRYLISPNEPIVSNNTVGFRVCDKAYYEFEVAAPLFWISHEKDIEVQSVFYNTSTQSIEPIIENVLQPDTLPVSVIS